MLPILVAKTLRIASRIKLVVIPLTVQEARNTTLPLPPNIPEIIFILHLLQVIMHGYYNNIVDYHKNCE